MYVEPLRLEAGDAVGNGLEPLADRVEVVQSLPELKIRKIMRGYLVAQEDGEFFVLLENRVLEVGAEHMMTMFDAVDDGRELAVHPAVEACAEDLSDLVGG